MDQMGPEDLGNQEVPVDREQRKEHLRQDELNDENTKQFTPLKAGFNLLLTIT